MLSLALLSPSLSSYFSDGEIWISLRASWLDHATGQGQPSPSDNQLCNKYRHLFIQGSIFMSISVRLLIIIPYKVSVFDYWTFYYILKPCHVFINSVLEKLRTHKNKRYT